METQLVNPGSRGISAIAGSAAAAILASDIRQDISSLNVPPRGGQLLDVCGLVIAGRLPQATPQTCAVSAVRALLRLSAHRDCDV
jgi:hypothetical protein